MVAEVMLGVGLGLAQIAPQAQAHSFHSKQQQYRRRQQLARSRSTPLLPFL